MSQTKAITKQIESILRHLEIYLPLANVHMVEYFTRDVYKNFLPVQIQKEIESYGHIRAIESIFNQELKDIPNIKNYIEANEHLTLKNTKLCLNFQQFQQKLIEMGYSDFDSLKLNIFMNPKKSHEVEIMSCLIATLKQMSQVSHIIDIGDGKGYLSSMLALNYKVPVLGIDASKINTDGAIERARKLSKVWNGVVKNEKSRETHIDHYKQVTQFVDETVDFNQLINNVFLEKPKGVGIVGLHTCGNLAPACLELFHRNDDVKLICNVGCCYHFLTEYENDNCGTKFPMSNFLKDKRFILGRAARMIGCQSMERILFKKELPSKTIFQRALLEVLIEKSSLPCENRQVGRFRKECPTFLEYAKAASKRIKYNIEMSDDEVNGLYKEYENRINELNLFYLIRNMLGPVIESLILLDRLLYLQENGYSDSYLVQLFDPVVSPRCYGVIAMKLNAI